MQLGRRIARIQVPGPFTTRNPGVERDRRLLLRQRIEAAAQSAPRVHGVGADESVMVRIRVLRPLGWTGDVDNIAKPVLDGLGPILGRHANGSSRDERVRGLEVWLERDPAGVGHMTVEVWACRGI
jgi:hypothetical protein